MGKLRKLHEIDWIVHFILLLSIQPMMYYSRRSLQYFRGFHSYKITVIHYYLSIYIVLSHLNVNYVCLTPTINPINEYWSVQIQPEELQHFRNNSGSIKVDSCTSTTHRWTQHLAFFAVLNQAG